jgi:EAL domain-containing protein (putative c-di-GMP-specific phosphodiesterase class I)
VTRDARCSPIWVETEASDGIGRPRRHSPPPVGWYRRSPGAVHQNVLAKSVIIFLLRVQERCAHSVGYSEQRIAYAAMSTSMPSDFVKSRYSAAIDQFLEGGLLVPVFQPVASLTRESLYGYEGTIRGPQGSRLHLAPALLAEAAEAGLREHVELECARCQVDELLRQNLPGKLFLNMSGEVLAHAHGHERDTFINLLTDGGISPNRIVIEITEYVQPALLHSLIAVVRQLSAIGVTFALDNFGGAHSSFRVWSELAPDIVKIDKFYVQGIHADRTKRETVKLFLRHAELFGTQVVAEGIEEPADYTVVRDLGIQFGQGFLLGRPNAAPSRQLNFSTPSSGQLQ